MEKKGDKPTGEYKISRTKGFHDKLFLGSSFDLHFFYNDTFDVLSCSCEDYGLHRGKEDFSGPTLLAQYILAIKRVNDYAKENNLNIITETLCSDPMEHYIDERIANPPKYLERKIVRLSDKPEPPTNYETGSENVLMIRSIDVSSTAYNSGLCGTFNIGIPAIRNDLFNSVVNSVKTLYPIPSPAEFRKMLLSLHTDKDLGMAQEILGSMGFENTNSLFTH